MITETLFQIPGIGYTSYQALTQGRYSIYHVLYGISGISDINRLI